MSKKIPTMSLGESDDHVQILKQLQVALLKHPVASQALLSSLAEEGREFAKTEQGGKIASQLAESELLRRVWRVWEATSLWMFDDKRSGILPSGYVDTIFRVAADREMEAQLEEVIVLGEQEAGDAKI